MRLIHERFYFFGRIKLFAANSMYVALKQEKNKNNEQKAIIIFWNSYRHFPKFFSLRIPEFLQILTESKFENKLKDNVILFIPLNLCYVSTYFLPAKHKFKCVIFDPLCIITWKENSSLHKFWADISFAQNCKPVSYLHTFFNNLFHKKFSRD